MLVGILSINHPDTYTPQPWHGTLLVIAVASVALMFNTFLAQKLPIIEGIILIIHVFGFFSILIVLWVLARHPRRPKSSAQSRTEEAGGAMDCRVSSGR